MYDTHALLPSLGPTNQGAFAQLASGWVMPLCPWVYPQTLAQAAQKGQQAQQEDPHPGRSAAWQDRGFAGRGGALRGAWPT